MFLFAVFVVAALGRDDDDVVLYGTGRTARDGTGRVSCDRALLIRNVHVCGPRALVRGTRDAHERACYCDERRWRCASVLINIYKPITRSTAWLGHSIQPGAHDMRYAGVWLKRRVMDESKHT